MVLVERLKAAGSGWAEDEANQMGAAVAYYALFSMTPLLMIAIAIIGSVYGDEAARDRVVAQVETLVDRSTAETVRSLLDNASKNQHGAASSIIGLLTLLYGASGIFTSLRTSLQRIWRLDPLPEGVVAGLIRTYLLSLVMVLVSSVFFIALVIISTVLPFLYGRGAEWIPGFALLAPLLDFLVSVALLTLLFLFTFRFLSDNRITYAVLFPGALVSAILFAVGKIGIGVYLSFVNLGSAYGTAGSVVVFLVWIYYSAMIVFFGAEVVRTGLPAQPQKDCPPGAPRAGNATADSPAPAGAAAGK